jgi:NAD(P)-dependent dehydrogenase (short-subunit alcohol dehydrogenase family)
MIDPELNNRVVMVTGGDNPLGIGATTARAFAAQGAAVFVHFLRQPVPEYGRLPDRVRRMPHPSPGTSNCGAIPHRSW